jgi:hypothetical protein
VPDIDIDFATILVTSMLLLFHAIGVLILLAGMKQIRHGLGTRSWPTTDAVLERCVVESRRTGGHGIAYHAAVKYSYAVDGVRYTGDTLAIGYAASNTRQAHEAARRRVLDMEDFVIRYHPEKPEMSTIFASENALIFGTFVMGLFWLTFTTCMTFVVLAMA